MDGHSIGDVRARRVWDSRGRPTVECEVTLLDGSTGRAIVPAGASKGTREAVELRDGGAPCGGLDVQRAVAHVNGEIAAALAGLPAGDQAAVDARLIALDGTATRSRLGANALLAASMATAHAAAASNGEPLHRWLAVTSGLGDGSLLPLPQIQIYGGGAHAGRRVDIQDFMIVCPGARSFAQALEMTAEVYRCAGELMQARGAIHGVADEGGWWPDFATNERALEALVQAIERAGFTPGSEVAIALDIAASEFGRGGRYTLGLDSRVLDSDGLIELLLRWIDRYPIASVEDPLAEDDVEGFVRFTRAVGQRVQVVGDDLLVTRAALVRDAAARGAANCVLLKPNQRGTLTETLDAWRAAREGGFAGIVSARSGETEDTTIVHLAIGWGVGQLKVGAFARGERMAKWNEALRIEERLGARARFAGATVLGRSAAEAGRRSAPAAGAATLAIRPLTPSRWADFEAVFNARGCAVARGCWCMYYRESGRQALPPGVSLAEQRRKRMRALAATGPPPGLIAYRGRTPVGWVTLGPRSEFAKLRRSPVMKPVDERPVWSVVCFVVPAEHRHQGVASALLQGAIAYARKRGARLLEAYPVDKVERGEDDWLWHGAKSMYDKAGFVEVARRKPTRPVVRLALAKE